MYQNLGTSIARKAKPRWSSIQFGPWPDGYVSEVQAEQMTTKQLSEALNVIQVSKNYYRTRDGSTLVCSGCTGEIVQVDDIQVGGTWYTIISDTAKKLYYNDSGTATAIATLEGEARFCGFMGLLIIFDGSYVKAWDGTDFYILYDNGTGSTTPFQVNNRTATATTTKALGNGTITSVELSFTSQTWDSGYTIPPTHIYAQLKKVGSPTGTITAKLKTAADVVMASSDITTTVASLTTDTGGQEYEAIFDLDTEVTTEMSPNTSYKVVLEYSGGDAGNYVSVEAVNTSTPMFSLKPGKPPKLSYGVVEDKRLYGIEGTSGTNPSYLWYCNTGDHLDWSTSDGGGYAPVIDDSATNYPIGSIASFYGSLWLFGTPRQPFMGELSGSTPSSYVINKTLQKVSADYKSTIVTPDDIIFLHPGGVDSISNIQEYGDIAATTQTDKIRDKIHQFYDSDAVAGYDPIWGLYLLKLNGTDYIYAVHTRAKSGQVKGYNQYSYSPATRWEFNFADSESVTAFGSGNGQLYVGTDDGRVFGMTKTTTQDNSRAVTYALKTNFYSTRMGDEQAYKIGVNAFGETGGAFTFKFYVNTDRIVFDTLNINIPADSGVLTLDMDSLTADAGFSVFPETYYDRENLNFNYRNLMVGIEDITLYGQPLYFGPIEIINRKLGGF